MVEMIGIHCERKEIMKQKGVSCAIVSMITDTSRLPNRKLA